MLGQLGRAKVPNVTTAECSRHGPVSSGLSIRLRRDVIPLTFFEMGVNLLAEPLEPSTATVTAAARKPPTCTENERN